MRAIPTPAPHDQLTSRTSNMTFKFFMNPGGGRLASI